MTGTSRGRGRPPTFTPDLRQAYLDAVAVGATLTKAATEAGVGARWIRQLTHADPDFARQVADARKRGRDARMPHDRTRYRKLGCRCPQCTADATAARTTRRHNATRQENTDEPRPQDAQVHQLPTAEPGFPPLRPAV